MDLSVAPATTTTTSDQELLNSNIVASSSSGTANDSNFPMMMIPPQEKEHMFDKVVTPSDVGKLNRLVIPKQHAERYFPLDSTNNQNGTLLNFQDRNGKMWRFRYSYWNSSQSYVMTKGWSRFVKEKKLDAGDIVSFQRGIGDESKRSTLYIDWRHRPDMSLLQTHHHQFGSFGFNFSFPTPSQYPNRFHPLPEYNSVPMHRSLNIRNHPRSYYNNQGQDQFVGSYGYGNLAYYTGSPLMDQRIIVGSDPLVIESVPVLPGRLTPVMSPPPPSSTAGKRLRLFGVNMECCNQHEESWMFSRGKMAASSSSSAPRLNLSNDDEDGDDQFAKKGKSSFSLDFNP